MSQGTFLFIVNGEAPIPAVELEPERDPGCRPVRKRPHHKSRRGCLACKRRRVKCDEQFPCSNCSKRHERCLHSERTGGSSVELGTRSSHAPRNEFAAGADINLLHLELFSHFQRDLLDTLAFPEIWQQVLPWSFQEPYIMCTILSLAAIHLCNLRPEDHRYSDAATHLRGKSMALFSDKLSNPITTLNSEALISVCILMHYISWSRIDFIKKEEMAPYRKGHDFLTRHLSNDPLLQLSFGVQTILCEAYRTLAGSDSVFLTTGLYSPIYAIELAIVQQGGDPWRFVDHFMSISDGLPLHRSVNKRDTEASSVFPQCTLITQEPPLENIAKRLSLLFCLVSMSTSPSPSASQTLISLQPDIEHCFFSFPVHYSGAFRELALQGDSRALIMLCHFYRAARILLTSPRTWWARRRSRIIESLILQDLTSRGFGTCILGEGI